MNIKGDSVKRLWVLLDNNSRDILHAPNIPVVHTSAQCFFLEDRLHDYTTKDDHLIYFGSFSGTGVWAVLEYEEKENGKIYSN